MPVYSAEVGTPFRISTSGLTCVSSAPMALLGVAVAGALTAQVVSMFGGRTASSVAVVGTSTFIANTFFRLPMDCPAGLTVQVTNEDVDLTIFWIPSSLR